ncbi:MAG: hypothetical protein JXB29_08490 [Sedimentisphaerales bacterium]|nr:hypothetical protein [Sedimentisphaerales bacterium]
MCSAILGAISIIAFAFATWVGFVRLDEKGYNPQQWENRFKDWTNKFFKKIKWKWPINTPYALTKLILAFATLTGILSIVF